MENPIRMDDLGVRLFFGNSHMLSIRIWECTLKFCNPKRKPHLPARVVSSWWFQTNPSEKYASKWVHLPLGFRVNIKNNLWNQHLGFQLLCSFLGRVWGCEDIIRLGHLLWVSWFGVGINEGKMTGEILPNAWTNNTLLAWGVKDWVSMEMEMIVWFKRKDEQLAHVYVWEYSLRRYLDPPNTSKTPEKVLLDVQGSILHSFKNQ